MNIEPIAYFHSPFKSKFGIPRQSGLVETEGKIVFEPAYRDPNYLRGLENFDYIWLIWEFSANKHHPHNAMVRPPVLGGNMRMGVFATRSPFRPNHIGLSSVRISFIEWEGREGPVLKVKGADLMDGTPIFDIKPYVVYADSHPDARSGFVDTNPWKKITVEIPDLIKALFAEREIQIMKEALALDPRPQFHHDPEKIYGMPYGDYDVRFRVRDDVLTVVGAVKRIVR